MAKITVDSTTRTITMETEAGADAPAFARGKPVTYTGEFSQENLMEAGEFIDAAIQREMQEAGKEAVS